MPRALRRSAPQALIGVPAGTALTAFVTYDRRLIEIAKIAGLPVASPGQD